MQNLKNRGPVRVLYRALRVALLATLAVTCVTVSFAQTPAATPPAQSPSDPPFWARPRPAQPVTPAECACDEKAGAQNDASGSGRSTVTGIVLAIGGLLLLGVLWRSMRERPSAGASSRTTAVRPTPSPAAPVIATPVQQPQRPSADRVEPAPYEPLVHDAGPEQIELDEWVDPAGAAVSKESQDFYREVANSLSEALTKNPSRQDLWRKLFEVYSTAAMSGEFVNLAYAFLELHGGHGNPHWVDIGTMGHSMLPEHELFREFGAKPAARRIMQFRRFYDRKLDQGALFRVQEKLEAGFNRVRANPEFNALLRRALTDGVQRPSPLASVPELEPGADGAHIFLKREDRRRVNDDILINALGQVLLAQHLGCKQVLAATRDGVHGQAVATVAARLGLGCVVYIAEADLRRHYARVLSMRKLGAQVRPVHTGTDSRFDDARQYAVSAWIENLEPSQYISGLSGGPQPFPMIVGEFQSAIGTEALGQMKQQTGRAPGAVVVHARDGYFGMGLLRGFLDQPAVKLYYVDAPDPDQAEEDRPPASGHLFLREHRWLRDTGRVNYLDGNDQDAMRIVEQYHAAGTSLPTDTARTLAHARQIAQLSDPQDTVLVMYSSQDDAGPRAASSD